MEKGQVIAVALSFVILASCGGKSIYKKGLDYVNIKKGANEVLSQKPAHPYIFDGIKLRQMLSTVKFSKRLIILEDMKSERLFDDETLGWLVSYLVQAFQKANEKQVVVFSFVDKEPWYVIRRDYLTQGRTWVAQGKLHIEFARLRALLMGDYKRAGQADLINRARGLRVLIELGPGQTRSANPDEIILDLH